MPASRASDSLPSPFLVAVAERVLLSDGAMGTALRERGVPDDDCLEKANIDRPALVRQLHREYIAAGADLIQTNTFGANRFRLARHGLEARTREINLAAAKAAGTAKPT